MLAIVTYLWEMTRLGKLGPGNIQEAATSRSTGAWGGKGAAALQGGCAVSGGQVQWCKTGCTQTRIRDARGFWVA